LATLVTNADAFRHVRSCHYVVGAVGSAAGLWLE
jgi:hypothetical protein